MGCVQISHYYMMLNLLVMNYNCDYNNLAQQSTEVSFIKSSSEFAAEQYESVTLSSLSNGSVYIVYNYEQSETEVQNENFQPEYAEVQMKIKEETLYLSMELNESTNPSTSAAAASLPYNTLLIIILVPVLSVGILTIAFVMFCLYWRRRKLKNGISDRKLKEKLDKFKQRKIESQRELSISTLSNISSMVGDGSVDFQE